ncbi:HupE / UreJ protein [Hydrobacter penzbergensis]|uniref:HupE / UreJ protein n=1 Tax=Hydrobacter penzbergensis TaxID=1235997 RepID=A0A8X8II15_9BACT|nr:HupE/UreJ family protein [Hydrobacter penzbergensis]SDX52782.1 HupE / UreJ protein [Hydrobacter penzbergensis]
MNEFGLYFKIGYQHIADLKGLDHILFIMALCLRYQFADWTKILILVTAFTIGHSITLALSVLDVVRYSAHWIEFLIPCTIVITAISNLFVKKFSFRSRFPIIYFFALFFGLIHGLGFSNYLKSLLGKDHSVVLQLLAFNVGLEVGQLVIVLAVLLISFIFVTIFRFSRREYLLYVSGGIFALALQMALQRVPF